MHRRRHRCPERHLRHRHRITNGVTAGSNVGATSGPDPITSTCGFQNGADVWYSYTATCTGVVTAEFCNAGSATFDTVLTAWTGACGSLVELNCNDDFCGLQSQIVFPVTIGTSYYLSVAGYNTINTGTFNLSVNCLLAASNDACATALILPEATVMSGSTLTASSGGDPVVTNCGFSNGPDVWYVIVPSCSGPYTATTCDPGTQYDTVLGIWDGTGGCGNLIAVACNDDDPNGCTTGGYFGLESRVSWTATAGTPYYISVSGYAGGTGNFNLIAFSGGGIALTFTTGGPGSIGYSVVGGPPGGLIFTAVTLLAGAYPSGWFFGIDITFGELQLEINQGFPFITLATSCGSSTVGPFPGVPSGLSVYGVALGLPADRRSRR